MIQWKRFSGGVLLFGMLFCLSGVSSSSEGFVVPPHTQVIVSPYGEREILRNVEDPYVYTLSQSPGATVGNTYYDLTENGSMGRQINFNSQGNVEFSWMWLEGPSLGAVRHVWYRCLDNSGIWGPAAQVVNTNREGFSTISALSNGKAIVNMHALPAATWFTSVATDLIPCLGAFGWEYPDTIVNPGVERIWPMVDVGQNNGIHVVNLEFGGGQGADLGYVGSADAGTTWSVYQTIWVSLPDPFNISGVSQAIAASPVSGKVVVAWIMGGFIDVYYKKSTDYGVTWSDTINLTDYANNLDPVGDTVAAWISVDAFYDYNDNLHFVLDVPKVRAGTLRTWEASKILHYNESGTASIVASGWWNVYPGCNFMAVSRPNLGVDPATGDLFCVWTQFRDTLSPQPDRGANGLSNGDIYAARSTDGGTTWGPGLNLTNSPSPGCTSGNCDDDRFASLARVVNDTLHITYLNSRDAGTGVIGAGGSTCPDVSAPAVFTLDQVRYLKVPASMLPVGVEEKEETPIRPSRYVLSQNRPNPFGSLTTIAYSLPNDSRVSLAVYDIAGRLVKTLVNGEKKAGQHTLRWDRKDQTGSKVTSGIYFYRLKAGDFTQTRKMVVLQ